MMTVGGITLEGDEIKDLDSVDKRPDTNRWGRI